MKKIIVTLLITIILAFSSAFTIYLPLVLNSPTTIPIETSTLTNTPTKTSTPTQTPTNTPTQDLGSPVIINYSGQTLGSYYLPGTGIVRFPIEIVGQIQNQGTAPIWGVQIEAEVWDVSGTVLCGSGYGETDSKIAIMPGNKESFVLFAMSTNTGVSECFSYFFTYTVTINGYNDPAGGTIFPDTPKVTSNIGYFAEGMSVPSSATVRGVVQNFSDIPVNNVQLNVCIDVNAGGIDDICESVFLGPSIIIMPGEAVSYLAAYPYYSYLTSYVPYSNVTNFTYFPGAIVTLTPTNTFTTTPTSTKTPTPTNTSTPTAPTIIDSQYAWTEGGYLDITGHVQNTLNDIITQIEVTAHLVDINGIIISGDIFWQSGIVVIEPNEILPFEILFTDVPASVSQYEVWVSGWD